MKNTKQNAPPIHDSKQNTMYILFSKRERNSHKTLEVYNVKTLEVYNVKTLEVYNVKTLEVYNVKTLEVYTVKH